MVNKIIIGITGASGIIYGVRLLEKLAELNIETHLVVSKSGQQTREFESDYSFDDIKKLASKNYSYLDLSAKISSGSFLTDGMIIAPCSIKTMSEIATGLTANLLSRAADVVLKERKRLVLMLRETPLHSGHIESMLKISKMGAIIAPPVPAFYIKPKTIDDIINHSIGRVLDLFDLKMQGLNRW